jgi:hypothetical protein
MYKVEVGVYVSEELLRKYYKTYCARTYISGNFGDVPITDMLKDLAFLDYLHKEGSNTSTKVFKFIE